MGGRRERGRSREAKNSWPPTQAGSLTLLYAAASSLRGCSAPWILAS